MHVPSKLPNLKIILETYSKMKNHFYGSPSYKKCDRICKKDIIAAYTVGNPELGMQVWQ